MEFNHCVMSGVLQRDPDIRPTKSGGEIGIVSIKSVREYKGRENRCYMDAVFFDGEIIKTLKTMHKDQCVLIGGRLETDSWVDKQSGAKRYKTKVVGQAFSALHRPDAPTDDVPAEPSYQDEKAGGENGGWDNW